MTVHRNRWRWGVAVATMVGVALTSGLGRAAYIPDREHFRVLFIGNSQTSTNNLPAFVSELARASSRAKIVYRTIAPSAVTLEGNWFGGKAVPALTAGRWDAVVMQQGPSVLPEARAKLCVYARAFADAARAAGARPYLLMVWPRRGSGFAEVIDAYAAAAAAADATLLPAGAAWGAAWRRMPGLELHKWDGIHPSRLGTYLAALVVYAGLWDLPQPAPNALVVERNPFWVPRDLARLLRTSAQEALNTRYPARDCS